MSLPNIGVLDLALLAACGVLLLLSVFLLVRLGKRRKECAQLRKDLDLQKSRVLARKEKIWELRKKLRDLSARLSEDERKLLNSYTQEEIEAFYPDLLEALRQLLREVEIGRLPKEKQAGAMSAAIRLSHLLMAAFRVSEEPLLEAEDAAPEDGAADRRITPRRVLIVDDNEDSLRFSAEIVEASGFLADLAASGEKAVEKVRASREGYYDLILLDVVMHDKNGYETCREIRRLPRTDCERIPVVALTANSFSADYVQLVDSGMNDRLAKPITRESFLEVADKWSLRPNGSAPAAEADAAWSSVRTSDGSAATVRA